MTVMEKVRRNYFAPGRNRSFAERLFEHVRNNSTDQSDRLVEYDLKMYSDPIVAEKEREKIFERLPMMALHSSQVPEPGSFATVQLNRTSVIVSRQDDGSLKALVNACRHRGAQVESKESGKRKLFTCPYHGWSYTNDGSLKKIAFGETFGKKPCDDRNLITLPVEERHGFIWIVEDPNGTINVAEHLGSGMDQVLAEYDLGRYHCYRQHNFDFPQNWKIMADGLVDGYHVQFVHGKTISAFFYPNMMGIEDHGHHGVFGNPRRRITEILDQEPGSVPLDNYVIFGNLVTPNSQFVLHPHHIEYWTIYQDPTDVSRCRVHLRYLTPEKDHDERGHEILAKNWKIAVDAIINEDVPIGNMIQASAGSPCVGPVILGLNELSNQVFHRAYHDYMNA